MGDHAKKSESEDEIVIPPKWNRDLNTLWDTIERLQERVLALEKAMIEVKHLNTDDGSRHRNDGGWFD